MPFSSEISISRNLMMRLTQTLAMIFVWETNIAAIAREIHDELGPDTTLALAPVGEQTSTGDQAPGGEGMPEGVGAEGHKARERSGDNATWRVHFRRIEERIDRLDKTVATAVNLLRRVLHPDKTTKPETSAER